ncbi:MAG: cytochrome c biogenesis protein CcmG/thiol:disulfide interchange protein DsbE [Lentisphaeria bacterium]
MTRIKLFIPLAIFMVMAIFLFRGLYLDPNEMPSALVDKPLPEFSLPELLTGETIDRQTLIGKPFLLNVWATWCPTCIQEHPYLVELSQNGVVIVGLNYKDEDDKAKQWLKRLGNPYAYNVVDAEGRMGLDLGVYGAPETFVVDSNGVIRYRHVGVVNDGVWKTILAPMLLQ